MANNCCCALPRQEAAAPLSVLLLYCQVCLIAPPKIVAGAAEAEGTAALRSLLVWLDNETKFRVFLPLAISAFACWMSLRALPEPPLLICAVAGREHRVLQTLC